MKVEYDVAVPFKEQGKPHAAAFWNFYNNNHKTVRLECDDIAEAKKCSQSLYMLMTRRKIFDVLMTRRKNVVYLMRNEVEHGKGD